MSNLRADCLPGEDPAAFRRHLHIHRIHRAKPRYVLHNALYALRRRRPRDAIGVEAANDQLRTFGPAGLGIDVDPCNGGIAWNMDRSVAVVGEDEAAEAVENRRTVVPVD